MEYAVLAVILVAALLGMQMYMKRGLSGSYRGAMDSVGEQYDPRDTAGSFTTTASGTTRTNVVLKQNQAMGNNVVADVLVTTVTIDPADPETSSRTGNETVGNATGNLWQ